MAFALYGGTLSPGYTIRVYLQFNNYQYSGPKVIHARPFSPAFVPFNGFLLTSDIGYEQRLGSSEQPILHVYSIAIKNVGAQIAALYIQGGDVL